MEFLNDKLYNSIFNDNVIPKKDVILPYRLLFQLINLPDIHQDLDDNEFWRRVVSYLRSEANGKIGSFLKELNKKLDFSNENIIKIEKILVGNIKKISPSYFTRICNSTGFVTFFLKDALEYIGLLDEKKSTPQRLYKNALYKTKVLESKANHIKDILDK